VASRFPIRFTGLNRAMLVLGFPRRWCAVEVTDSTLEVRMSWAFHASVPLATVSSVAAYDKRVWAWGVHGWRGRWLVNGSSSGLVRITFDPVQRARMAGFPLRLRELCVSVEDRAGLLARLAPPAGASTPAPA
jgi:hypothetical protein